MNNNNNSINNNNKIDSYKTNNHKINSKVINNGNLGLYSRIPLKIDCYQNTNNKNNDNYKLVDRNIERKKCKKKRVNVITQLIPSLLVITNCYIINHVNCCLNWVFVKFIFVSNIWMISRKRLVSFRGIFYIKVSNVSRINRTVNII